ncbi:MAG: hypothetical protein QM640_11220 [Niabella sp.]
MDWNLDLAIRLAIVIVLLIVEKMKPAEIVIVQVMVAQECVDQNRRAVVRVKKVLSGIFN